jgi:hypothetical protein
MMVTAVYAEMGQCQHMEAKVTHPIKEQCAWVFLYEICFFVYLMMHFCELERLVEWCGDCECWIEKEVEAEYYPSIYKDKMEQTLKQTSIRGASLWAVIWIHDLQNSRNANHNNVNKDCKVKR